MKCFNSSSRLFPLLVIYSLVIYYILTVTGILRYSQYPHKADPQPTQIQIEQSANSSSDVLVDVKMKPRIFVAMGLCWGENVLLYGKENYPYSEAALRAISLWHTLTEAQVLLQIVHTGNVTKELLQYRFEVEKIGAKVFLYKSENISCITASQVIRLVAFSLPGVGEDDIILTADVDAFIMSDRVLKPLQQTGKKIYLWRHQLTQDTGQTLALSFLGAVSSMWRSMVYYNGSLADMVDHYNTLIAFQGDKWYVDQLIISRAVLETGICSLNLDNPLWREIKLEPQPVKAPDTQCWYGDRSWDTCDKGIPVLERKQCVFWHFYPNEGVKDMEKKYREILEEKKNTTVRKSF